MTHIGSFERADDARTFADATGQLPSYLRCALTLIAEIVVLRLRGFASAVRLARWATRRVGHSQDASIALAEAVAQRVALVAAFYPGRARCLEQSLTLYWQLRRLGMDVVVRLGTQPLGFGAHAWVEYRGTPIFENEMVRTVVAFPELPL